MISIDKLDKINIYASSGLSNDDYITLSLLYRPLIGADALSLYQTLYAIIERNGFSSDSIYYEGLLDLLCLSDEQFNSIRLKLEAIGLLETFSNGAKYVFLLKHPLTSKQFLVDSEFSIYLNSKIGNKMFDYILSRLKIDKFDRTGFTNLTVSFDEVFETIDYSNKKEIKDVILGRKPNSPVIMKNREFDYDYFFKSIDRSFIQYESLEKFKNNIINKSYIYGFSEDEMINLYNDSINKLGYFDSKILNKKAYEIYCYKTNNNTPYLGEKSNEEDDEDVLKLLASISIKEVLDMYYSGYPASYLKTINDIYESIDYDRTVLNILIINVLKEKNGDLPNLAYFKKVAKTWLENGINDVDSALNYINRAKKRSKNTKDESINNSRAISNTNVKTSDWVEDYKKNLTKGFEE